MSAVGSFDLGMSGTVEWPAAQGNVVRWSMNKQRDVHDGTVMVPRTDPDYGYRIKKLGHAQVSGTVEYLIDPTWVEGDVEVDDPEGTPAVLTLTSSEDASVEFTGSVFLSSIQVVSEVDGVNRCSADWVSTGLYGANTIA